VEGLVPDNRRRRSGCGPLDAIQQMAVGQLAPVERGGDERIADLAIHLGIV
jgi:hypothetical protein